MQQLTASPRGDLTEKQVRYLLAGSPGVEVGKGVELVSPALDVIEDISTDLAGGKVARQMNAAIHGTCQLQITRELQWGLALLRPYMTLAYGGLSARWNKGVYALATPERTSGEAPVTWDVAGFDRLYLLDRPVGDSYVVRAGTSYLAAIRAAITAAGLTGVLLDTTAASSVLDEDLSWPLIPDTSVGSVDTSQASATSATVASESGGPTTWLGIINYLLRKIAYRGLWCDENGFYRSGPYESPENRPMEYIWTRDTADSIIVDGWRLALDEWGRPNSWRFVRRGGDTTPVAGNGLYIVPPTEAGLARKNGLEWVSHVELDAADQASLVAQGDARVASDLRSTAKIDVKTGPFPGAGHADIYGLIDPDLGLGSGVLRVQETSWELDLMGADMTRTWELVS